jgi:hypothetical protein
MYPLARHAQKIFATVSRTAWARGMDQLKKAIGQLYPPQCPNCRITMRWFRSELVRDTPEPMIAHLFVCPNCKRAQRSDAKFTAIRIPPDKLASPQLRLVRGSR